MNIWLSILIITLFLLLTAAVVFILARILPKLFASLSSWLLKRMMRKVMTNMTGQDPYANRKQKKRKRNTTSGTKPRKQQGRIIPPEYGVDVEYTEIHSYSEDIEVTTDSKGNAKIKVEEQISDAEWVEVRD